LLQATQQRLVGFFPSAIPQQSSSSYAVERQRNNNNKKGCGLKMKTMKQFWKKHTTLAFFLFEGEIQHYHAMDNISPFFLASLPPSIFLVCMGVLGLFFKFGIAGMLFGAAMVMLTTMETLHFINDWDGYQDAIATRQNTK
jgi:hypothetical protein